MNSFSRWFLRLVACSVLMLPLTMLCSVESVAGGYLHASGLYIVDGSGTKVKLRGMGLGGWLVPEGYMLGLNSPYDSPTGFRNALVAVVGSTNADAFLVKYRAKFVQRKDVDSLHAWGFNSIRLPMHYALLSPSMGTYSEDGFAIIDSLLSWCEADSIYLILDLHCAPGGQNSGNISDYQGYPSLWEDSTYRTWTAELWKQIATRYATKQWIGGYDLLNETNWSLTSNTALRELMIRITDSIRTVDANHLVFVEGNSYATDFTNLKSPWDNNMALSFHKYWNENTYAVFLSWSQLRATAGVPLWLGESGENSNQWFSECIQYCELLNIGWSWWTLKKIESISCPLSINKASGFATLQNYWNNGGTMPSESVALAALDSQLTRLDAEKCVRHPDFIDALFRAPFTTATIPYADNTIPGRIYAVNYDMGQNNYAYYDVDYENTGSGVYNSGYAYRNDGVDIESTSDGESNGYDVGWTQTGEFLAYTAKVETSGTYDFAVRVAAGGNGGTVNLAVDGTQLTSDVTVPATGGWQTWVSLDLGQHSLAAGSHKIQLNVVSGSYNLSTLDFTLIAADAVEKNRTAPLTFALGQNYPNPFNPTTTIKAQWPSQSRVTLVVYDVLGRAVATLADGQYAAGTYAFTFDASGLASGVYFYRLTAGNSVQTRRLVLVR